MDVSDLKVFAAVAEYGGMSRAASALHMVQSNVTARVRQLEQELGCALFDRHSRGVSLTDAGRRLLPYANRIGDLLDEARDAARGGGALSGVLRIGALETTTALRLSPRLARFVETYPEVDLILRTGTTAEMVDAVLEREVEGAFVCGPVSHRALQATAVFREELVVLARPGINSFEGMLADSNVRIVVLKAGCSYRQRLEDVLARRGVAAPRLLEFGTLEAIGRCVSAGLGITMLPRHLVGTVWPDDAVSLHPVPADESLVETLYVRRRDAHISDAAEAFLALCRDDEQVSPGAGQRRRRR